MKFHFLKYPDGEKIVTSGEECNHLKFLISGEIRSELITQNEKMRITELIQAPNVIAPDPSIRPRHLFPGQSLCRRNRRNHANRKSVGHTNVTRRAYLPHQFVEHTLPQIAKGTRKFHGSFVQRPQRTTGILGVESHATKIGRHTHHLQTKRFNMLSSVCNGRYSCLPSMN